MKKLLLVDGNSIMNRAFYGVSLGMQNKDGKPTNALYGFLSILFKNIEEIKPDYVMVAFDSKTGADSRKQMYDGYKKSRHGMPEELAEQMPEIKEILDDMGVAHIELADFEGDDIIGTAAKKFASDDVEVWLLSGDRDLFQLLQKNIKMLIPRTKMGKTETEIYDEKKLKEEYGLTPSGMIELKALMGDSSDEIPGAPGVGPKTATTLLQKYGTINKIYKALEEENKKETGSKENEEEQDNKVAEENGDENSKNKKKKTEKAEKSSDFKPKVKQSLLENKDMVELSKKLGTIQLNANITDNIEDFAFKNWKNSKTLEDFKYYGFNRFIERFHLDESGIDEAQKEEDTKNEELIAIENAKNYEIVDNLDSLNYYGKAKEKQNVNEIKNLPQEENKKVEVKEENNGEINKKENGKENSTKKVFFYIKKENSTDESKIIKKNILGICFYNEEDGKTYYLKNDTSTKSSVQKSENNVQLGIENLLNIENNNSQEESIQLGIENLLNEDDKNNGKEKNTQIGIESLLNGNENNSAEPKEDNGKIEEASKYKEKNRFFEIIKPIFEDKSIEKIGYDVTEDYVLLRENGIKTENIAYDVEVAGYDIDAINVRHKIEETAEQYIDVTLPSDLNEGAYAYLIYKLYNITKKKLEENGSLNLFNTIEMPLVEVLSEMQFTGMQCEEKELKNFGVSLKQRIAELTNEIYEIAGEEFNINSTQQLGKILFEKLGLKSKKKTKSGYSTSEEVLNDLVDENPIISKVLEYRGLMKLNSTYVEGLIPYINKKTGRIHSYFHQTITATGRISSTNPNLQNIPARDEFGKNIKKAFVPKEGYVYIDADYSQVELRVLAHISGDENMIKAFEHDEDIHREVASKVFNVPFEEVTKEQRSRAKAVNFGIVYGITSFGLAKQIHTSRKQAQEYIDSYLEKYSGIRNYMEKSVIEAERNGYVETLFGRRRNVPELKSKNYMMREFGKRVAMNTPIQGTAADIMKIAMNNVYKELKENNIDAKVVLQVHDELLIEANKKDAERTKQILQSCMENAKKLKVPLKVEISEAENWFDLK